MGEAWRWNPRQMKRCLCAFEFRDVECSLSISTGARRHVSRRPVEMEIEDFISCDAIADSLLERTSKSLGHIFILVL